MKLSLFDDNGKEHLIIDDLGGFSFAQPFAARMIGDRVRAKLFELRGVTRIQRCLRCGKPMDPRGHECPVPVQAEPPAEPALKLETQQVPPAEHPGGESADFEPMTDEPPPTGKDTA